MGKGKRSRERNATDFIETVAPKKKDSAKIWTNVMIVAVAVLLVASMALSFVVNSGVLLRAPFAFKSENFEINGAMMQYMFKAQYTSFYNNMYSYMSYFTLDTSKSLRDQIVSGTSTSSTYQGTLLKQLYGNDIYTDGTWFDFFWYLTSKQAKQMLVYCEAAKAMGMELTKEDISEIDAAIKELDTSAATYGYPSTKSYIYSFYGTGVSKKDIRNVMELSILSSKYYEQEAARILDEITDEQVNAFFEENKSDYLKADYYYVSFDAALEAEKKDEPTEEELAKFAEDVAKAKEHANAVAALETVEEVEDYMIEFWLEKYYDSYLTTAETDGKKEDSTTKLPTITDKDIPTDEIVKAENKAKVFEAVKNAIENETATDALEPLGTTAYDKVLDATVSKLLTQINKNIDGMLSELVAYSESTDEAKWIFAEDRVAGDVKVFNSDDAAEDEDEAATTFTAKVYRIEKPRYVQETLTREFGHILITEKAFKDNSHEGHDHAADDKTATSAEADALAKAEAERILAEFVAGELTKEAFEALAKDKNEDSNEFYADVQPGEMVTEMNDWLFDEERKAGDTAVIKTTYGYHVTWLVEFGKEIWFVESKDDYYVELLENFEKDQMAAIAVETNIKIADKISA